MCKTWMKLISRRAEWSIMTVQVRQQSWKEYVSVKKQVKQAAVLVLQRMKEHFAGSMVCSLPELSGLLCCVL